MKVKQVRSVALITGLPVCSQALAQWAGNNLDMPGHAQHQHVSACMSFRQSKAFWLFKILERGSRICAGPECIDERRAGQTWLVHNRDFNHSPYANHLVWLNHCSLKQRTGESRGAACHLQRHGPQQISVRTGGQACIAAVNPPAGCPHC